MVKFCVDQFKEGMLLPQNNLLKVIRASVPPTKTFFLNLSRLSSRNHLEDMKFLLSNAGSFKLLCELLNRLRIELPGITFIDLSMNGITSLEPLSKLTGFKFSDIDLRSNQIKSIDELQFLKKFQPQNLFLSGNDVTSVPQFKEKLQAILPSLKKIDEIDLSPPSTSANHQLMFDSRRDEIRNVRPKVKIIRAMDVNDHLKSSFESLTNDSWNQVYVEHKGKVGKKIILEEMTKQLFNMIAFFPCYYKQDKKLDSFFLYKNFDALTALLQNNLTMFLPEFNCTINFELHLNCAEWAKGQKNWKHTINYVVRKRFKEFKLDLDRFADDIDLADLVVPISSIHGLTFVLNSAREINNQITAVTCQHNSISKMESLAPLASFPNLVSLDLRNNNIDSLEGFPRCTKIVEVFLDGNPICTNYYDKPWKYVESIRRTFPLVQYIDKCRVDKDTRMVHLQNFFVSPKLYTLASSFVKLFFDLYDSANRKLLRKFYHPNALFTLSCELTTRPTPNISRNLNKSETGDVFMGNRNIVELFNNFPQSLHDFTTMCVDVPLMTHENILIVVNGFFKETGNFINDEDVMYGFTRTFLLKRMQHLKLLVDTLQYCIINEQLHIREVSPIIAQKTFKKDVVTSSETKELCRDLLPTRAEEEEAGILILKEITQLGRRWCERFV